MKEVKISIVSYLNSSPFIHGIKNFPFTLPINVSLDIPSVCAEKILNKQADIGLIPVAMLSKLQNHKIITDYCIGAEGEVKSVLLLSKVPLDNIKTILLDYQSRTSVALIKILAEKFWKIKPEWKDTQSNYENAIKGNTAAVVIGDRALHLMNDFPYRYDLAKEWQNFTGLPFMFACWVSITELPEEFYREFSLALKKGFDEIEAVIKNEAGKDFSIDLIRDYLTNCISYKRDEKKEQAKNLFLNFLRE